MNSNQNKQPWLETGYQLFALHGPGGLKVETLAQQVGTNKSSFYHYFADLELFTELLLEQHLRQAAILAEKERQCQSIDPDLIQVLAAHKTDLLFNRQLRVLRHIPVFEAALKRSGQEVGASFLPVWVRELNLQLSPPQLEGLFELALENFFLQITPDHLHEAWLRQYFSNLQRIARNFSR
jgi:AcrR family transcriptional regulator